MNYGSCFAAIYIYIYIYYGSCFAAIYIYIVAEYNASMHVNRFCSTVTYMQIVIRKPALILFIEVAAPAAQMLAGHASEK